MDLVEVARLRSFRERWGRSGLERLFSSDELLYCLAARDPGPSLAARFAAKEAFFKAVGTGWGRGGDWREVEVQRAETGAPRLHLRGRAVLAMAETGADRAHVTLTHARSTAGAVVVLEG
jgi:holo-[acyl-carrier protein] synthase